VAKPLDERIPHTDLAALTDLCTPWCVHVAATLRLAEHLAAGPASVDELAARAGCDPHMLHAMLTHLVGRGVFTSPAPGRFAVNDAARALDNPFLSLDGVGGRVAVAWSTLLTLVRTGASGYSEVFGVPFWADLAAHQDLAASFDALMGHQGYRVSHPDIPLSAGWPAVRTVVDVGGGTGSMLASLLAAHPALRGILVDQTATVARASFPADVRGRVELSGQSFFDPLPAGAEVYLLRRVLNDWSDAGKVAILRRCRQAVAPSGAILICGGVSADGAVPQLTIDMVLTGGRTIALRDFERLADQAGLCVVATAKRQDGFFVECARR
jgi:2,7-dihydroxy-5-methyl-1-naphthoate 7-O-methyltransferase